MVGIIDESDILWAIHRRHGAFTDRVASAMSLSPETVEATADIDTLMTIFRRDLTAIVVDGDAFLGVITRIDLLNWLRRERRQ